MTMKYLMHREPIRASGLELILVFGGQPAGDLVIKPLLFTRPGDYFPRWTATGWPVSIPHQIPGVFQVAEGMSINLTALKSRGKCS